MFFFLLLLVTKCSSGEKNGDLYVLFARPDRNPLEIPTKIPICIHNSMPGNNLVICSKCKYKILQVSRNHKESFLPWCSMKLSNENFTLLVDQLNENYSLCFSSGKKSVRVPIGKPNKMLYTQYSFYFSESNGTISLFNISTSISDHKPMKKNGHLLLIKENCVLYKTY